MEPILVVHISFGSMYMLLYPMVHNMFAFLSTKPTLAILFYIISFRFNIIDPYAVLFLCSNQHIFIYLVVYFS